MKRFVLADPKRCIGCNTCAAACSMTHKAVGLQAHPRLAVTRTAQGTAPILCRHCEDAPCAAVCPVNAITRTADAVQLNETLCIGCKLCAIACPFGAITPSGTKPGDAACYSPPSLSPLLAWDIGVRSVAVKCDLCDFREAGPACVEVCPTKAMFVVSDVPDAQDKRMRAAEALGGELPGLTTPEHE